MHDQALRARVPGREPRRDPYNKPCRRCGINIPRPSKRAWHDYCRDCRLVERGKR